MNVFGAYIEDYHYIKLIIPKGTKFSTNQLYLVGNKKRYHLEVFNQESFANELYIHTHFSGEVDLHIDYTVNVNSDIQYALSLGKIIRTPRFDFEFYYEGPLGVEYSKEYSIFRLWTPVAKEVILVLLSPTKEETKYHLSYQEKGLWEIKIDQDLESYEYYYLVRINQSLAKTLDPYARSSNANSEYNYVIDLQKTYSMKEKRPSFSEKYTEAIIYEINLRDFSIARFKDTQRRSFYQEAITSSGKDYGIEYLQSLGITHVQILPLNVFGGVDEKNPDAFYNWGYNPIEYNVPSGWYSKDPNDPYSRINELKQMVDGFHKAGLLVNLDVVYNHVYEAADFSWMKLVPGYAFRYDKEGFLTNSSGCSNDIATERKMMHRFILDSVCYWMKEYHIDGFRFDLMGLMDASLMNDIFKETKKINNDVMIYGEGWKLETNLPDGDSANMYNFWHMPSIAFFNDRFRNLVKGNSFKDEKGFAMGEKTSLYDLKMIVQGSSMDEYLFLAPTQSINYIECHDNITFYDQLMKLTKNLSIEQQKCYVRLGLGMVLLSQGIPFIHSGQEFLRTKKGIDDSYNLGDDINKLDWKRKDEYEDVVKTLQDLITLRKKYPLFRLSSEIEMEKHFSFDRNTHTLSYRLQDKGMELQVICKNNFEDEIFYFAPGVHLIFNGKEIVNEEIDSLSLNKPGVYVLSK